MLVVSSINSQTVWVYVCHSNVKEAGRYRVFVDAGVLVAPRVRAKSQVDLHSIQRNVGVRVHRSRVRRQSLCCRVQVSVRRVRFTASSMKRRYRCRSMVDDSEFCHASIHAVLREIQGHLHPFRNNPCEESG